MGKIRIVTVAIHQVPGTQPIEDMSVEEVVELGAIVNDQTYYLPPQVRGENGGEE